MSHKTAQKRNTYGDVFSDWEIAIAKKLILGYERTYRCLKRVHEFEDLLQECLSHWWEKRGSYREGRGASRKTFMAKVIKNKLLELKRKEETSLRRVNGDASSLDKRFGESAGGRRNWTLHDTLKAPESPSGRETGRDLQGDLTVTLGNLPPEDLELVQLLREGDSVTHISERLGIHRSTVYQRIKRIRKLFVDSGLQDYTE
jgi:RNA polymerase sigma factor (sigma-70 family)